MPAAVKPPALNHESRRARKPVRVCMYPRFSSPSHSACPRCHPRMRRSRFLAIAPPVPPGLACIGSAGSADDRFMGHPIPQARCHPGLRSSQASSRPSDSASALLLCRPLERTLQFFHLGTVPPLLAARPSTRAFVLHALVSGVAIFPGPRHILLSLESSSLASRPPVPHEPHCFRAHPPISLSRTH